MCGGARGGAFVWAFGVAPPKSHSRGSGGGGVGWALAGRWSAVVLSAALKARRGLSGRDGLCRA